MIVTFFLSNIRSLDFLQWVNLNENAIKILGINFTYNPELTVKLNFENKVTHMDDVKF